MAFEIPNKNRKKRNRYVVRMHGDVFEYFKMYLKSNFSIIIFIFLKEVMYYYVICTMLYSIVFTNS